MQTGEETKTKSTDNLSLRERMSGMSGRERIAFLWYYYKWPVLLLAAGAIVLAVLLTNYWKTAHVYSVLTVTLINADTVSADNTDFFQEFLKTLPGMEGDEVVSVDAGLSIHPEKGDALSSAAFQVLGAELLSGEIDVYLSDETLFSMEQENGGFLSLSEAMDSEFLTEHEDHIYYAVDPATGEEEPFGFILTGSPIQDGMIYPKDSVLIMGIGSRSENTEVSGAFVKWLAEQS